MVVRGDLGAWSWFGGVYGLVRKAEGGQRRRSLSLL